MNILLVSVRSHISRGGIAVWTDRFMEACPQHDLRCRLVNTEMVGLRAEQGSASRNWKDEYVRTKRIFRDLKVSLKQTAEPFDVAHLNTSCGTFGLFRDYMVAKRIKRHRIPLMVHFHCDIPFWVRRGISRKYLGKLLALSDQRLVLCENSRRYLEERYGVSSIKVPNFIEDALIASASKPVRDQVSKVFFVGRVTRDKGAEEIYSLARRFPHTVFELVGDIGDEIAGWDKPDNVHLLGGMPHEEVIRRMDDADVFLFPSHTEGFSVALTEAMARGLPSIATDVGANADMLDGGCGVVTDPGDVEAMASALEHMTSADTRQDMCGHAVSKVRTMYTTDAVMRQLVSFYRELVGPGDRKG